MKGQPIFIQEVATRDGFQNEAQFVDTDDKIALVDRLSACGYGNKMSGQDARSLGFMAAAIKLLTAVSEHAEAKGDVRAEAALKAVMTEAFNETESLPVFDPALVAEGTARYQKMGLSPAGVLNSVDASELEAS